MKSVKIHTEKKNPRKRFCPKYVNLFFSHTSRSNEDCGQTIHRTNFEKISIFYRFIVFSGHPVYVYFYKVELHPKSLFEYYVNFPTEMSQRKSRAVKCKWCKILGFSTRDDTVYRLNTNGLFELDSDDRTNQKLNVIISTNTKWKYVKSV